jgi:hypothetical protein
VRLAKNSALCCRTMTENGVSAKLTAWSSTDRKYLTMLRNACP